MKRIISASYRTDIPAFQSEKFFEDYKKGYTNMITKVGRIQISLRPEDVYCIVFWTKNTNKHFLDNIKKLRSPYYMQWTITGYGKDIEPMVPDKEEVIRNFISMSESIGQERTIWRYDPIFISDKYTVEYHLDTFRSMCESLGRYTQKCVISFMDEYGKIQDLVRKGILRAPTTKEVHTLAKGMADIAELYGISIQTCSERQYDLTCYGIEEKPCIDAELIEKLAGETLPKSIKRTDSFRRCNCAVNTDIGSYHTCEHDCLYCYAK